MKKKYVYNRTSLSEMLKKILSSFDKMDGAYNTKPVDMDDHISSLFTEVNTFKNHLTCKNDTNKSKRKKE